VVVLGRLELSAAEVAPVEVGFVTRVVPPAAEMRSSTVAVGPRVVVIAAQRNSN
jgi:hypothetical protein